MVHYTIKYNYTFMWGENPSGKKMFSINYRITGNPDLPKFHSHEDFEIFMFHKGICRYLINNQIYDLQPGDILLMDGLALHRPNVPDNCDYVRSNLHFIPDWIEPVLELMKAKELLDVFRFDHHYLIRTSNKEVLRDIEAIFEKMYKVEYSSRLIDSEKEWEMKFCLGSCSFRLILCIEILVYKQKKGA